jgi:hypothetical protein
VAIFISAITFTTNSLQKNIAGFLLMVLLFLCGKVFINSLFRLRKEFSSYLSFVKARKRLNRYEKKLVRKTDEAKKLLAQAEHEIQAPETALRELQAQQEYKTHVFMSEYNLAVETRKTLNKSLAKQFA